jgi:hypothetical protein
MSAPWPPSRLSSGHWARPVRPAERRGFSSTRARYKAVEQGEAGRGRPSWELHQFEHCADTLIRSCNLRGPGTGRIGPPGQGPKDHSPLLASTSGRISHSSHSTSRANAAFRSSLTGTRTLNSKVLC